jgi:hypothetical protein
MSAGVVVQTMADQHESVRCRICGRTFEDDEALEKHVREVGLVD